MAGGARVRLCRLDVRGTGSSPGIALDEYTARETQDGYDAVEWLAAQPWSNGEVAMWGISYGGFTAIQVALLHPPHLAAIVPMMATDDRYTDDVHYLGGCVTVSELSQYAVSMVGDERAAGGAGLPRAPPGWTSGATGSSGRPSGCSSGCAGSATGRTGGRDPLAPHWDRLTTPMLLIGGWMDEYVDAALRMLERCTNAPRRALIGNWVHSYPDGAYPGPNLDWNHELVRFLDHWLKGIDNGVMDEPALVAFRHEWARAGAVPGGLAGRLGRRAGVAARGPDRDGLPARDRGATAARAAGRRRRDAAARDAAGDGGRARAAAAATGLPRSRRSAIGRPSARGRASPGAPATRRTVSPATSGPTTPACRPSRRTRSRRTSTSSARPPSS